MSSRTDAERAVRARAMALPPAQQRMLLHLLSTTARAAMESALAVMEDAGLAEATPAETAGVPAATGTPAEPEPGKCGAAPSGVNAPTQWRCAKPAGHSFLHETETGGAWGDNTFQPEPGRLSLVPHTAAQDAADWAHGPAEEGGTPAAPVLQPARPSRSGEETCMAENGGWACTGRAGHGEMDHAMHDGDGQVLAVWPASAAPKAGAR